MPDEYLGICHFIYIIMKLVEEIGEVAEVLNKKGGRKHAKSEVAQNFH